MFDPVQEFDLLSKPGNLGFYSRCEITTIFLKKKGEKQPKNLYTLCVLEESTLPKNIFTCITPKLQSITAEVSLGIVRHYESLENTRAKYVQLFQNNTWENEGEFLGLSKPKPLPKQFVPSTENTPLNSVLKN